MELLTIICVFNTMILTAIATVATINLLMKWKLWNLLMYFQTEKESPLPILMVEKQWWLQRKRERTKFKQVGCETAPYLWNKAKEPKSILFI